jgi:dCTP deaminase
MLLSDGDMKELYDSQTRLGETPFMVPFTAEQVAIVEGYRIISYGLTSYGYDVRVGFDFKVFTNAWGGVIDPKNLTDDCFVNVKGDFGKPIKLPPNSFALCHSIERVKVPRNCLVRITGKSTYARSAQVVPVTPLEPEWEGQITIEISNTAPVPCLIYPGEGIMQLNFELGNSECLTSYKDRSGKYMHQTGIVLPTVQLSSVSERS